MWGAFSVFFFLLDMVTAGGEWFFFPVLAWGIGLAAQAVRYYFPVDLTPEEEAIEQEKEQLRHQKVMQKLTSKHGRAPARKLRVAAAPQKQNNAEEEEEALAEEEEALQEARHERRRRSH
jgi:hypothetical protein